MGSSVGKLSEEEVQPRAAEAVVHAAGGDVERGVEALLELSSADDGGHNAVLFRVRGVVDTALKGFNKGSTDKVKEDAMGLLQNLAFPPENKVPMFTTEGVLDMALMGVNQGATDGIRGRAMGLLRSLALAPEISVALFRTEGVVEAALWGINEGRTDGIQESAMGLLRNLAFAPRNKIPLFHTEGVVDAALKRLSKGGGTDRTKESAMWMLSNLAIAEPVSLGLAQRPGFPAWVASNASPKCSEELRRASTACLLSMSSWPSSTPLLDAPEVLSALSNILASPTENQDTRSRAAMALAILVGADASRSHMLTSDVSLLKQVQLVLVKAVDSSGRHWPLDMPLQALSSLLLVESNRTYLAEHGLPSLLTRALALALLRKDARSCDLAVGIIQQLCLDDSTLAALRADANLKMQIAALLAYAPPPEEDAVRWDAAKRAAHYLDFFKLAETPGAVDAQLAETLDAVDAQLAVQPTPADSGAVVMVSYSRVNKDVGVAVNAFLTAKGVRVWRDERHVSDDALMATMQAVQGCNVFICVLSNAYHQSDTCRAEFELARKLKKRIVPVMADPGFRLMDSWMGLVLRNALFYEVVPMATKFEAAMTALVERELLSRVGVPIAQVVGEDVTDMRDPRTGSFVAAAAAASGSDADVVSADVRAFVVSADAPGAAQGVSGVDAIATVVSATSKPPLPDSETEVVAWLKGVELMDVADALKRHGFTSARKLAALRAMGVREVSEVLEVGRGDAALIKEELGRFA